jgi:glutaredoxin
MKQVVVYSKASCPQCVKVKNELTLKAVEFVEVRVDLIPEMRDFLLREGHRSVPQVYVDGVHVKDTSTITNEVI